MFDELRGLDFDFAFFSHFAFLCQFGTHCITSFAVSDTLRLQKLQSLQFGHGLRQFHQVDVSAFGFV